ncbi:MAG: DnaD domain protein [Chloroflexi bacterium]|nr:DnaD domain protein [Chloroflexota bacterium]
MRVFAGFPAGRSPTVALPESIFTDLIPMIDDLAELKLTLLILWRLGRQHRQVRYVRHEDILQDKEVLSALGGGSLVDLECTLQRLVDRGTLLYTTITTGDGECGVYFANSAKGRAAVAEIGQGEWPEAVEVAGRPSIFELYHQNIGVLTPLLADELRDAERSYPPEWIEDAFREAVAMNKRSWRYVRAILERWAAEGRGDEADRRGDETDRRRYIEGEYGEFIQH